MAEFNAWGQVVGQRCSFCGRPSEQCIGRCKACGGHAEWDDAQMEYRCPCGSSVLRVTSMAGVGRRGSEMSDEALD